MGEKLVSTTMAAVTKIVGRRRQPLADRQGSEGLCHQIGNPIPALYFAVNNQEGLSAHYLPLFLVDIRLYDDVDQPELVFQHHKYEALCGSRLLAADHEPGDIGPAPVSN
jgi:hypothetical protein